MSTQASNPTSSSATSEWMPRFWQGCNYQAWFRMLARNHFAVHPIYASIAGSISISSLVNTSLGYLQESLYGSRLDKTPLLNEPLFIIGHWRTGTTLLHELLTLDPQHSSPTTYLCMAPHHFLISETLFKRIFFWMLPTHRPMDNMKVGWDRPQEDEFALCMLGVPSPYLTIAFPNHPPQDQKAFDLDGLPRQEKAHWKQQFVRFLKRLTYRDPRRLVLKSPTHSFRIPTLLELFPQAKFIHIIRNPYVVFSSTVNLWKSLYKTHGLQRPRFEGLEEYVFTTFTHLYDRIEQGKKLIPPGHFHEVRYENLVASPIEQMRTLYETLQLEGFGELLPRLEAYWQEQSGYQTNRYPKLSDELHAKIRDRWGPVIEQYGYAE